MIPWLRFLPPTMGFSPQAWNKSTLPIGLLLPWQDSCQLLLPYDRKDRSLGELAALLIANSTSVHCL